jgi:hypothetical protein
MIEDLAPLGVVHILVAPSRPNGDQRASPASLWQPFLVGLIRALC